MKINVVIIEEDVDRGAKAGRRMADELRAQYRNWEMHVHVRRPTSIVQDDAYAEYKG